MRRWQDSWRSRADELKAADAESASTVYIDIPNRWASRFPTASYSGGTEITGVQALRTIGRDRERRAGGQKPCPTYS